jgi:hypothetical protein
MEYGNENTVMQLADGKTWILTIFIIGTLFTNYCHGNEIEEHEMGGEYSTNGEMKKVLETLVKNLKRKRLLE